MKKIITIILCMSAIFGGLFAQTPENQRAEIGAAIALANGSRGQFDRPKAYEILLPYAQQGNARAMNALGLMHILGYIGNAPDTVQALYWLTRAGEAGFLSAYVNLGDIYKYAHGGIKMDLTKSFYWFDRAAQAGAMHGQYAAGYMLYKGLGCEQNYEKAFEYFTDAANDNYSPAMYMLGLCYRNGYGTEQNEGEAQYWLATADRLGYTFATEEMEKETPENLPATSNRMKSVKNTDIPANFRKIVHLDKGGNIDGEYEGVLVVYDWSGKHILKETPLALQLATQGDLITGIWVENQTDTAQIFAARHTDGLRFTETRQYRADHYNSETPVLFSFEKAELQFSSDESGSSSLVGNIRMFSPQTMEYERPMYISLRRNNNSGNEANPSGSQYLINGSKSLTAYPVPFTDELNIAFMQRETAEVTAGIYSMAGECVYFYTTGILPAGEQRLTVTPTLAAGTYIVRLTAGARTEQTTVISTGRRQK